MFFQSNSCNSQRTKNRHYIFLQGARRECSWAGRA